MRYKEYCDRLAEEYIWGGHREISLAENIFFLTTKNTKKIIDVGCGDGYLLYYLGDRLKTEYLGLDLSNVRLNRVKKKLPFVKLLQSNVNFLPFKDNEFETVLCSEVLEHVPDFKKALDELIRVTKKELIITIPNEETPKRVVCPKCGSAYNLDGHINRFSSTFFKKLISHDKTIKINKIRKFNTIFSYNKTTLALPFSIRCLFDQFLIKLERYFSFFKPNYLLIKLVKK